LAQFSATMSSFTGIHTADRLH